MGVFPYLRRNMEESQIAALTHQLADSR